MNNAQYFFLASVIVTAPHMNAAVSFTLWLVLFGLGFLCLLLEKKK
jgi:hypothetical protein